MISKVRNEEEGVRRQRSEACPEPDAKGQRTEVGRQKPEIIAGGQIFGSSRTKQLKKPEGLILL